MVFKTLIKGEEKGIFDGFFLTFDSKENELNNEVYSHSGIFIQMQPSGTLGLSFFIFLSLHLCKFV